MQGTLQYLKVYGTIPIVMFLWQNVDGVHLLVPFPSMVGFPLYPMYVHVSVDASMNIAPQIRASNRPINLVSEHPLLDFLFLLASISKSYCTYVLLQ